MIIKEPLLRVIVEAEVYKAIMAKIEPYEDSDRRFERLNNSQTQREESRDIWRPRHHGCRSKSLSIQVSTRCYS